MSRTLTWVNRIDKAVRAGTSEADAIAAVRANLTRLKFDAQFQDWVESDYRARLENRARKAAGQEAPSGECQICGRRQRLVRVSGGAVTHLAHHGYERPAEGWQTASCRGARHLPYEVSRDLIPVVVEEIERYIVTQVKGRAELDTDPPEKLQYEGPGTKTIGRYRFPEMVDVPKPEGWVFVERASHPYRSYDYLLAAAKSGYDRRIANSRADVVHFRKRYDTWEKRR